MPLFTREYFSESTNGRGISLGAVATPGTLIHSAHATADDEVYLYAINTSASDVLATFEFGGVTDPDDLIIVNVEARKGLIYQIPGIALSGALDLRGFAAVADVINIFGHILRLT